MDSADNPVVVTMEAGRSVIAVFVLAEPVPVPNIEVLDATDVRLCDLSVLTTIPDVDGIHVDDSTDIVIDMVGIDSNELLTVLLISSEVALESPTICRRCDVLWSMAKSNDG